VVLLLGETQDAHNQNCKKCAEPIVRMKNKTNYLGLLALLSIFLGPIILVFRANSASSLEKFIYVTMTGPLVLVVIYMRYTETKKKALGELNPQSVSTRLKELELSFWKLTLIGILATLLAAMTSAWFLFVLNQ